MKVIPIPFTPKFNNPLGISCKDNCINQQEIDILYTLLKDIPYEKGSTFDEDGKKEFRDIRKSKVKWIPQTEQFLPLYHRIEDLIQEANDEHWNFNLNNMPHAIQYTEYHENDNGKYDWHIDTDKGEASLRKISFTLQLSDPSEYEGGDLEFMISRDVLQAPKKQYTSVIFPSYLLHRVTPVTRGVRKSLVLWVGGVPFR